VMLEKLQPTLERAIAGEATCKACGHVWFILCPEVAEPPYECPNCPQNQGYCHPTWKVYCSVKEDLDGAKIWVDGFSRVFSGRTLMEAAIPLKAAIEALCIGDTTLLEAIA
jgi:hypothetical protein